MSDFQNPVIVIPGITATTLHDDYPLDTRDLWTMILHKEYHRAALHPDDVRYETVEPAHVFPGRVFSIYDEMIEALRHDLSPKADKPTPVFAFPYDWRQRLQDTAVQLDEFVGEVVARTKLLRHYKGYEKVGKVDLVGHSMGGLLICEYLRRFGHKKRVGKIATLGTPFLGSLEAVVKLATGMGNLSGTKPSERERETARTIPALYQLLPWFDKAVTNAKTGAKVSLFKPGNWQRSVLESLIEYVRLNSVKYHRPRAVREKRADDILKSMLAGARELRDTVSGLSLAPAGLTAKSWLAIVGVGEKTRLRMTVTGLPDNPRFFINDDQYKNAWRRRKPSRDTGDGTVPLMGALPPFFSESSPVCVCPGDFGIELKDRVLMGLTTFHALLPNLNLAQRLVLKHLRPAFRGDVWGRRVPGVSEWNPPIPTLEEKDQPS